ncbi:MAG: XdhC/CoxI family protein [candidate division Zixibacteria bacterium]|nr:XdhC/CoxI family protein [candidate division Zixibacteria bacterium]
MSIFEEMHNSKKAGLPFVLATIVRTAGPSPRLAGAKMLVFPDGTISGTIGGGTFEKLVIDDCLRLLNTGVNHELKRYAFSQMGKDATGMSCGGEGEVFMEVSSRPKRLLIFGGGHICNELVRLAAGSEFSVCVIDDRPDILSKYNEPVTTLTTDSNYQENLPALDRDCYVVIVTRSHKHDEPVLAQVIEEKCAYIGMIGSKAKVRKMFASLEKSGVDPARLEQVHAPIGLNIKGEGPYEIAVSILAELISVKNKTD